jgi:hypothetical protein
MPISVSDAEREQLEAKGELERTQATIRSLSQREAELVQVVNGWNAIIAAKRSQSGQSEIPHAPVTTLPPLLLPVNGSPTAPVADNHEAETEGENRTQFVRDYIRNHPGATPEDLKRAASAANMRHAPSWPYGPLARLKTKGEIVKRRGRFYPNEQSAQVQ